MRFCVAYKDDVGLHRLFKLLLVVDGWYQRVSTSVYISMLVQRSTASLATQNIVCGIETCVKYNVAGSGQKDTNRSTNRPI